MNFDSLTRYVDSLASVGVPGCDLAVYMDHEPVYRHRAGCRDAAGTLPVRGDEIYRLYSCTKVFTTCAAMQLIERGWLDLDDPVSDYLPAYGKLTVCEDGTVRPARRGLTIRHLMSMQSGLDYDVQSPAIRRAMEESGGRASARELLEALAQDPLGFEPGMDFRYSLSHDVLAMVIEVASGQRFSDYLKENIFDPLELSTVGFALREADRPRRCAEYIFDAERQTPVPCERDENIFCVSPDHESGGAGLFCDVADAIALADAIACGGTGKGGAHILSPKMIQLWSANQLGPQARRSFDTMNRKGYSYALGVRTRVDLSEGGSGAIGEFGWDGAAGSWMMIDPHNHLSAFYAMHVREFDYCYDVIHPTLRGLIYDGLRAE